MNVYLEKENLSIEVTTRCTQACAHCFARAGRGILQDMNPDIARQVLADGRATGFRHLHITGGEPLLWPHIFPFIDEALALGYESIFLNTNGVLLDKTAARNLATSGALTLSVSIQGPEPLHDAVRGAGSYLAAAKGLTNALDAGLPACIFTAGGQSLLRELPRFAEAACRDFPGIRDITLIQLIRVPGDAFDLSAELLSPEDFLVLVRMAALLNLYGLPVSFLENPLASAAAHAMGMPWLPQAPPLYRPGKLVVMADGSITPAHSVRDTFGNFAPGALRKILGSEPYLRAVAPDETTCPSCRHVAACREKGMVRPSETFRDHVENVPFCKRVMDLVVKD
jgi:MoaA/NifB/PqqE/SkfB family radical SAM enzyme